MTMSCGLKVSSKPSKPLCRSLPVCLAREVHGVVGAAAVLTEGVLEGGGRPGGGTGAERDEGAQGEARSLCGKRYNLC